MTRLCISFNTNGFQFTMILKRKKYVMRIESDDLYIWPVFLWVRVTKIWF